MDIAILRFFEGIRTPILTYFFGFFSLLGEGAVLTAAVILIYWLAPKRSGEQILMTVLTSFCLNLFVKNLVSRPRPYARGTIKKLDPPMGSYLEENASFPSGHVQISSGVLGAVCSRTKRIFVWVGSGICLLFILLSRLYFGVHYPSDVLAGLLLGVLISMAWAIIFRAAYEYRYLFLLGFALISLLPLFFSPENDYIRAAGLLTGAAAAFALLHFSSEGSEVEFPYGFLRIPVGFSILAVAFMVTLFFPEGPGSILLKWFFLSFTGIFIGQHVFERLQI